MLKQSLNITSEVATTSGLHSKGHSAQPQAAALPYKAWWNFLLDPRRRKLHAVLIAVALLIHLALHYATYVPALRVYVANLPYFRLHMLHEAEFLLIIAYTCIVFRLKGGLTALTITAVTSIPFILTPYIFGKTPKPDEIRDLTIQVSFILLMGFLIVLLYESDMRRRHAQTRIAALQEADRIKTNFISLASHELRTPLTVLYGFSELLVKEQVPPEKQKLWAGWIYRESARLTNIVDDLLNVSRIQSGKMNVKHECVDVHSVVVAALQSAGLPSQKHTPVVQMDKNLPQVAADRDRFVQVLINLLSNAAKYSPDGGQITVKAWEERNLQRVVLSVTDQGIGISKEDQAQLFTTFHRIRRPETSGIAGNGLGLYIVKSLVELMNGSVWIESELNKGSTFYIALPVWQVDAQSTTNGTIKEIQGDSFANTQSLGR